MDSTVGESALTALRKTPLHQVHVDLGARMVDFAGWHMPIQYAGLIEEHQIVRTGAGVFDVSHMGRVHGLGASTRLRFSSSPSPTTLRRSAGGGRNTP